VDDFHPDLLVYPDPQDVHPDHWGLSAFTRLALTELCHRKPDYQPKQITYLVHHPDYPQPRGLKPTASLVPPAALYAINPDWLNWDLTSDQVKVKEQAVGKYKSQLPLLRAWRALSDPDFCSGLSGHAHARLKPLDPPPGWTHAENPFRLFS
jgi:LmbE family N-acetylglucosaminyl deacetylase